MNIQNEKFILNYPNSLLATAGSGDVLAGTIAGYLARFKEVKTAAILGLLRHSLAGKKGREEGFKELCAGQIISYL
jgi:NAD(P)H-hydrate epimerase